MTNDTPSQSNPPSTGRDRISGVFSQKKIAKIGTGTTARKTELTAYFLVEERENGVIVVQPLAANDVPFGPKQEITREDLLENYLPEPQKTLARAVASLSPQDMILAPIAESINFNTGAEMLNQKLIMEGIIAIAKEQNSHRLEKKLTSFLSPADRAGKAELLKAITKKYITRQRRAKAAVVEEAARETNSGLAVNDAVPMPQPREVPGGGNLRLAPLGHMG